jgi:hypothetical protein
MRRASVAVLALAGLAACGRGNQDVALADSAGRNLALVPPGGGGGALNDRPVSTAPTTRTLGTGSRIDASWGSAITSRSNKAGETVTISVDSDVKDKNGRVVIPAGSTLDLLITQLSPATNRHQADGKLALSVTSATIRGLRYSVQGDVTSVTHSLKGRGVGTAEAVKVGVGTAVGAAVGQAIGKDTKSTVIGGAVGAAGGAAAAAQTASRDVVVSSGAPVVITLTGPLTVSMK